MLHIAVVFCGFVCTIAATHCPAPNAVDGRVRLIDICFSSGIRTFAFTISLVIEDYLNAIRHGCSLNDVVETIGDLCIRLMEWTHDGKHLIHAINGFTGVIALMDEHEFKLKAKKFSNPLIIDKDIEAEEARLASLQACLLTQRGRLQILVRI